MAKIEREEDGFVTRIFLSREEPRGPGRLPGYNVDGPYVEVVHEGDLREDQVEAIREAATTSRDG